MAPGFPRLGITLLVALALAPGAARAQEGVPWLRNVVTDADIRRAGIVRLGELVRLAPWSSRRTVDEFTWRAADGSSALEEDRWTVVVDGQLVEPALLGVASLSRLPVDLNAIDSVAFEIGHATGAVRAGGEVIRIYTRQPAAGLSAGGRFATGSETGDPGPFAFVPPAAPNQDRFGHDAALTVAWRGGGWWAAAGAGFGVHIATDAAIFDRLLAVEAGFPRIEYAAPSLRLGFDGAGGTHRLLLGRNSIDDWFRAEALGFEAPAHTVLEHAGASGDVMLGASRVLGYEAVAERASASLGGTAAAPPLDIGRRTARSAVELRLRSLEVGLGATRRALESERFAGGDAYTEVRARVAAHRLIGGVQLAIAGSLTRIPGHLSPAAELRATQIGSLGSLGALLAAGEDPGRPHDGFWPLVERGLEWPAEPVVVTPLMGGGPTGSPRSSRAAGFPGMRGPLDASPHRYAFAGFHGVRRLWSRLQAGFAVSAETERVAALPFRELALDPSLAAWRGPTALTLGAKSRTARGAASLAWRSPRADIAARYAVRFGGGDSIMRRAARTVPRHRATVDARVVAARGLDLFAGLETRSGVVWEEYGGAPIGSMHGATVVDVGIRKGLANDRIHARLGIRNLFDVENRLHPEGADGRLSFAVSLDGELGGWLSGR